MAIRQNLAPLSQPRISAAVQPIDPIARLQSGRLSFRLNALDFTGVGVKAEWRLDALVPVHADLPHIQDARKTISEARHEIEHQQRSQHIRRQLSSGRSSLLLHGSGHHSTVAAGLIQCCGCRFLRRKQNQEKTPQAEDLTRDCADETIYLRMVRAYLGYALWLYTSESSSPLPLLVS